MPERPLRNPISEEESRRIAAQLSRVILAEKSRGFPTERGARTYEMLLDGFTWLLAHTRDKESNIVLDIGAGSASAMAELADKPSWKNLSFKATGLTVHPDINRYFGRENFTLSPAESLGGIPDNSVGAALSVFSVTYSAAPRRVAESIDRILVAGGIFKGVLRPTRESWRERLNGGYPNALRELNAVSGTFYRRLFKDLGYDTYLKHHKDRDVLLAIKPGSSQKITARELFRKDKELI